MCIFTTYLLRKCYATSQSPSQDAGSSALSMTRRTHDDVVDCSPEHRPFNLGMDAELICIGPCSSPPRAAAAIQAIE